MADQAHGWKPSRATVAVLERKLVVPLRMGGPTSNFDRYYTGVFRDGHKVVFLEMLGVDKRYPGSGEVHRSKPAEVPVFADGGCGVIRFSYDPSSGASSDMECNAELPGPPPIGRP